MLPSVAVRPQGAMISITSGLLVEYHERYGNVVQVLQSRAGSNKTLSDAHTPSRSPAHDVAG
jgi:hypothetical protein